MENIIASTYEVVKEIGSGGGGVVYLARHLRLGKFVVLKADKRTLRAKPEVLRREVDALKNLSHSYIPQVYDFISDGETVYTVMDYIQGESLDKPLRRGEKFEQARVIGWACQLLEALIYLHSQPPHGILHSDIKPSNIMLTPQDDIRLIDFNIALVLGEEGAVRVGASRGYASPEHYGIDYSGIARTENINDNGTTSFSFTNVETVFPKTDQMSSENISKKSVTLDVRSDIYSAGATLYHLLTGIKPDPDAIKVNPIQGGVVSSSVAKIIHKAMEPDPDLRYQSAKEMLYAFEHLHDNDIRTKRFSLRKKITAALLIVTFLIGGCSTFVGLKQMERTQNAYALSGYSDDALRKGDVNSALNYALKALPNPRGLLDPPYTAQAQRSLTNALGVYDLSDGYKSHLNIPLISEPIKVVMSPNGTMTAALTQAMVTVLNTETGNVFASLQAENSALSDMTFVDDDTIIYAGEKGITCFDIKAQKECWTGKQTTAISLSGNGTKVAALYKSESTAYLYDVKSGECLKAISLLGKKQPVISADTFADPEDALFVLDNSGKWLAASFNDGSLYVFDTENPNGELELFDTSDYTHFEGGFFGNYFAFSATNTSESVFAVIDLKNMEQTGGFSSGNTFHVEADQNGIYVNTENLLVKLHPVTGDQTEVAYSEAFITHFARKADGALISTENDELIFFDGQANLIQSLLLEKSCDFIKIAGSYALIANRDEPSLRVFKLENHTDAQFFSYDPTWIHDEARVSTDESRILLFRYDSFRLYDKNGDIIAEKAIPDAELVYDQQYRREKDGDYLEVIYQNGLIRCYSVLDGCIISEKQGEKPDESITDVFETSHYRIEAPLHGTPIVYDLETGKKVGELESEDYLTYVTETDSGLITEYITTQSERYGLLLNENFEIIADFPNLCDILPDERLIFDDGRGNLRECPIYSLETLIEMATKS